jgi:hypothetical protein
MHPKARLHNALLNLVGQPPISEKAPVQRFFPFVGSPPSFRIKKKPP